MTYLREAVNRDYLTQGDSEAVITAESLFESVWAWPDWHEAGLFIMFCTTDRV